MSRSRNYQRSRNPWPSRPDRDFPWHDRWPGQEAKPGKPALAQEMLAAQNPTMPVYTVDIGYVRDYSYAIAERRRPTWKLEKARRRLQCELDRIFAEEEI